MKKLFFSHLSLVIILFFISSCFFPGKIQQQNLYKLYRRNIASLNPEFVVFHETDSVTKVFFSLKTGELLYSKKESEENFMAKVKLHYILLESYESASVIDSSTNYITDICREKDCSSQLKSAIEGDFNVRITPGKRYLLEITTTDVYRNQFHTAYINIDKSDSFARQNFLLKSIPSNRPSYKTCLNLNEKFLIQYNAFPAKTNNYFVCRFYSREFPVALPPFSMYEQSTFDYRSDSIIVIETDSNNSAVFELKKKGFYHLLADSSAKSGLTLFHFSEKFPMVSTTDELIAPLRYITTKKEFSELTSNENKKESVDKFWMSVASNPDRAKELIRQYYNRVQDANRFFTSYMEGWKTDRGMIYIVFGPPNIIYKTSNSESWLYGEENNFMSINFNFVKVINPFSDNDYSLERSPIYKANYFKAVDTWREGRVFTTN